MRLSITSTDILTGRLAFLPVAFLFFASFLNTTPVIADDVYTPINPNAVKDYIHGAEEKKLFPEKTDLKILNQTWNSMVKFNEKKRIGIDIATKFGGNPGSYPPHPWTFGNPNSFIDYMLDGITAISPVKLFECMEPRVSERASYWTECAARCPSTSPWCSNFPIVLEYYWPETEVEINNFGISSFNPAAVGFGQLARASLVESLARKYKMVYERLGLDGKAPWPLPQPNIGQSHWDGLLPGETLVNAEAHAYRTSVAWNLMRLAPQSTNGWYFEWRCFFDALVPASGKQSAKQIHGWTEQPELLPFWRSEAASLFLRPSLYLASVPPTGIPSPTALAAGSPQILEGMKSYLNNSGLALGYLSTSTCASFRAGNQWPSDFGLGYKDIPTALPIKPMLPGTPQFNLMREICYWGGGQLYPVTGQMMGAFNPLVSAAFLARRAIELMSSDVSGLLLGSGGRIAKFDDDVDKLQRVFPLKEGFMHPTGCFKMNDVDEYSNDQEGENVIGEQRGNPRFPKGLPLPEHMGSIRYIYWNKRAACFCSCEGYPTGCSTLDYGDSYKTPPPTGQKGWISPVRPSNFFAGAGAAG